MKLGVAIPAIDAAIGGDPSALREFAQAAEDIGYQDLSAPDHVLGVNVASRPGWGDRNHDPFALFSFLAGCTKAIEFSTQFLILAQRQAVLVAKQAASLGVLCAGRFRLGVGGGGSLLYQKFPQSLLAADLHEPRPALRHTAQRAPSVHLDAARAGHRGRARRQARRARERRRHAGSLHAGGARRRGGSRGAREGVSGGKRIGGASRGEGRRCVLVRTRTQARRPFSDL